VNNGKIDKSGSYFNNLINQQVAQNRFDNSGNKKKNLEQANPIQPKPLNDYSNSILNNLAELLENARNDSDDNTDPAVLKIIYKLIQAGGNPDNVLNLLNALASNTDDIVFTRTDSSDFAINDQNKIGLSGGDLENFLIQSASVASNGQDIDKYLNTVTGIVNNCDYDDLRRFIDLTNFAIAGEQDLTVLLNYYGQIAASQPENMESNLFTIQTLMEYGASLGDSLEIMNNMETGGHQGKENMGELQAIIRDSAKRNVNLSGVFKEMAGCGDTIGFIEAWLSFNGMKYIKPIDYSRYHKIETLDSKKSLVIHEGDDTALFAQTVSSTEGVLPESVMYWNSAQTGPLANGTSYLDLSILEPGTYDIYAKIGNYDAGTDTARRRIIVLAKGEKLPDDCNDQEENKAQYKRKLMSPEKLNSLNVFFGKIEEERQIADFFQNKFDTDSFISYLQENGHEDLAKVILNNPQNWLDILLEGQEKANVEQQHELDEFRKIVKKEILEKYLVNREINQEEIDKENRIKENRQKEKREREISL
jgi:hypothetical protein